MQAKNLEAEMINKKYLIIGIIVLVVVIIAIFGIYFFKIKGVLISEKFDERTSLCIDGCENEECINNCKDIYYFREAKDNNSIRLCSKINDPEYRIGCEDLSYYTSSTNNGKISDCDNINEGNLKERCKRKIVYDEGIEGKNLNSCNKLNDWIECKDIIRINIAYINNDLSFCEQITDNEMKNICLDGVTLKIKVKENLEELTKPEQGTPTKNSFFPSEVPLPPEFIMEGIDPIHQYLNMY